MTQPTDSDGCGCGGCGGTQSSPEDVVTVIVLKNDGTEYGVNGWVANETDRRIYAEGGVDHEGEGEADEDED